MDWAQLVSVVIQISIFSIFISSIVEVMKGISGIGVVGLLKGLWNTLIHNKQMDANAFPVLNFAIAMLCCWAFNITAMSYIFQNLLALQERTSTPMQIVFSRWIDYFGTASVTYLGSDQFYKRIIEAKKKADELTNEIKTQ
jgi:hypothetical protein